MGAHTEKIAESACCCSKRKDYLERRVQLYGWDSAHEAWHGPNEVDFTLRGAQRLLDNLRAAPGDSWYGPVNCCSAPGETEAGLFAVVHDVQDAALAALYCNESRTGPVELLVALPAESRGRLRPEFAFEFVAYARFIGALQESAQLTVHDGMAAALDEAAPADSLVFSISTGLWAEDCDDLLSRCVERLSVGLLQWAAERHAARG